MILQLSPPIWVYTPLGEGLAILIIDYGLDHNTCWVIAMKDSNQIKHFDANSVRYAENPAYGFSKPELPDGTDTP